MTDKKTCEHARYADENLALKTSGCEECEKEGTEWVALRMCLSCSHVGCCDSSVGLHATKHFQKTSHPVMIALPDNRGNGATSISISPVSTCPRL